MTYFFVGEVPNSTRFHIELGAEVYDLIGVIREGSYVTIQMRLFGLTPAQYNQLIEAEYKGNAKGSRTKYQTADFDKREDAARLAEELNRRARIIFGVKGEKIIEKYGRKVAQNDEEDKETY